MWKLISFFSLGKCSSCNRYVISLLSLLPPCGALLLAFWIDSEFPWLLAFFSCILSLHFLALFSGWFAWLFFLNIHLNVYIAKLSLFNTVVTNSSKILMAYHYWGLVLASAAYWLWLCSMCLLLCFETQDLGPAVFMAVREQ